MSNNEVSGDLHIAYMCGYHKGEKDLQQIKQQLRAVESQYRSYRDSVRHSLEILSLEKEELQRKYTNLFMINETAVGALRHYLYGGSNNSMVARDALKEIEKLKEQ
jgi:hypothetical protein